MKKCAYCAREIGYHDLYCCFECQERTSQFYDLRERFQKVFSVFNGICVLGIGICIFLYAFIPDIAAVVGSILTLVLGTMYMLLPFPADVMIEKFKLKKALFISRCIAGALLFIGALVLTLHLFGLL